MSASQTGIVVLALPVLIVLGVLIAHVYLTRLAMKRARRADLPRLAESSSRVLITLLAWMRRIRPMPPPDGTMAPPEADAPPREPDAQGEEGLTR